jgi:hypothetical protein
MMRIKLFTMLVSAALVAAASAQEQADVPYDGNWSATVLAADGARQGSRLVIKNFAGTWYGPVGHAGNAKGSCKSRKFPVTVQESNGSKLAFTVWGATIEPGCKDLTIELKPTTENVLDGTVESVGTIKLVRR